MDDKKQATRAHKREFPLKRIEALINLAITSGLKLLEVGDIRIIPGYQEAKREIDPVTKEYLSKAIRGVDAQGKQLTQQEQDDLILYGPGGFVKAVDD